MANATNGTALRAPPPPMPPYENATNTSGILAGLHSVYTTAQHSRQLGTTQSTLWPWEKNVSPCLGTFRLPPPATVVATATREVAHIRRDVFMRREMFSFWARPSRRLGGGPARRSARCS